jgi:hypothetical protein
MGHKEFSQTKGFYLVALMLVVFILHPLNLFAEDKQLEKTFKVEVKDTLISVDVQDAELSEVLKEIERGTGVWISVGKDLTGKKITVNFENLDMESALREILRDNYYVITFNLDPKNKEKKFFREVQAGGPVIGSKPLRGKLITLDIPYGKGKGEVGASKGEEGSSVGPCSYAVDSTGNIYVLDCVNNRVQIFSSDGKVQSTVLYQKDIFATDIAVDKSGLIYIYDRAVGKLYQYGKDGVLITTITVDEGRFHSVGPMYLINDEIYVDTCSRTYNEICGYFLIGKILSNSTLISPSKEELIKPKEEEFKSGKIYRGRKHVDGYNNELNIIDKNNLQTNTLSTPSEGILTRQLLGEDNKSNFYLQTRTAQNEDRLYNIDKFTQDGRYVGTAQIPSGEYAYPSIKNFLISDNGNIYKLIPEGKTLKIYVFLNEDN